MTSAYINKGGKGEGGEYEIWKCSSSPVSVLVPESRNIELGIKQSGSRDLGLKCKGGHHSFTNVPS